MFGVGLHAGIGNIFANGDQAPPDPFSAFTADPAPTGSNANVNCNFRLVATLDDYMGPEFRIGILPGTDNALTCNHVAAGKWDGNPSAPDATTALIEAMYGGTPGFAGAIAADGIKWSDWTSSGAMTGMPAGTQVVASFNTGAAGQADTAYVASPVNSVSYFKADTSGWQDKNVTGYSGTGFNFGLAVIQSRGGSAPPNPPVDYIPLTYDAAIFSRNTVSAYTVTLPTGKNLVYRTIEEYVGSLAATVNCTNGSAEVKFVSVKSRECIRIGSAGDFTIQYCFLEAIGQDDDHADTIQIFSSGARGGAVNVLNSYVKAHDIAATAGMFVADNWGGTINYEYVVFDGGPFGLKVSADDTCTIILNLKDVYFIGPFVTNPFVFQENGTGDIQITQWENVRWATIVDGEIVPGDLIPQPF